MGKLVGIFSSGCLSVIIWYSYARDCVRACVGCVLGLSIQSDRKHCFNFVDNKNYLVGTVSYLQTL